jgi:hypothetical protein
LTRLPSNDDPLMIANNATFQMILLLTAMVANNGEIAFAWLPQDVLVGTDVEKLADYISRRAPLRVPGFLEGEQGGASGSLELISVGAKIEITRTFKEPGAKIQSAQYHALISSDNGKRL